MDSDWSLYVVGGTFSGASSRASRAKIFFYICIYRGKLANLGEFGVYRGKLANLGDFFGFYPFYRVKYAYIEGKFGLDRAFAYKRYRQQDGGREKHGGSNYDYVS